MIDKHQIKSSQCTCVHDKYNHRGHCFSCYPENCIGHDAGHLIPSIYRCLHNVRVDSYGKWLNDTDCDCLFIESERRNAVFGTQGASQ